MYDRNYVSTGQGSKPENIVTTRYIHTPELRHRIELNAQRFADRRLSGEQLRRAAVAIAVIQHEGDAAVMVTRRAMGLRAHGGQWALPGGRVDAGESSEEAALRELHEEVGLALAPSQILGVLDDYVTRSGYVITPVVVWTEVSASELVPNPGEVAAIEAFSFSELCRADSPRLETIQQSDREVLSMHYAGDVIYAPTGAILYQFREVAILGRDTRVAHYDQPLFAWR